MNATTHYMSVMSKGRDHRILFLSYWSAEEPLVRSTILPYLRMMALYPCIEKVIFITVERGGVQEIKELEGMSGIDHRSVQMRFGRFPILSRTHLFVTLILRMLRIVRREQVTLIDSKAALAGGIAYLVHRLCGVPYMVESFEPHSEYMADCGIWSRRGLYYKVSRWLELEQRRTAKLLVTVTWNYYKFLQENGVPKERIKVIPSITDQDQFKFNPEARARKRKELGWTDRMVGIYVGKFGGLYYDQEAFALFRQMMDRMGARYNLIILTNEPMVNVRERLSQAGIPHDRVLVKYSPHNEVADWLSVADHAFSTIRYSPNGLYQSPVKNGEYWMNGLPILLTEGVSDDHQLIRERPWSGAVFDIAKDGSVPEAIEHMASLLEGGVDRQRIMEMGREFRSMAIAERVYDEVFSC